MFLLIVGLILFLGIHSISILALETRNRFAAKSELGWKAVYSVIALIGLLLIIKGYAHARLHPTYLYVVSADVNSQIFAAE